MKFSLPILFLLAIHCVSAAADGPPHPVANPESPLMLSGPWLPEDPHRIDFAALPRVPSEQEAPALAKLRIAGSHAALAAMEGIDVSY